MIRKAIEVVMIDSVLVLIILKWMHFVLTWLHPLLRINRLYLREKLEGIWGKKEKAEKEID